MRTVFVILVAMVTGIGVDVLTGNTVAALLFASAIGFALLGGVEDD